MAAPEIRCIRLLAVDLGSALNMIKSPVSLQIQPGLSNLTNPRLVISVSPRLRGNISPFDPQIVL